MRHEQPLFPALQPHLRHRLSGRPDRREAVGRLSAHEAAATSLRLRRVNRIRTIQGSLAIEGNTLSEAQFEKLA